MAKLYLLFQLALFLQTGLTTREPRNPATEDVTRSPHGALNTPCQNCHTPIGWTPIRAVPEFEHRKTGSDAFRYTSTTGIAINMLKWKLDRPFVFLENGVSFRNSISVYHSLIADSPQGLTTDGITPGAGVSRSYLTVHLQPYRRISFDIYHNYFRDVPTAATALIGTGMVDKLLYQGLSAGVRVEPVRHFFVYTTLARVTKRATPDDR